MGGYTFFGLLSEIVSQLVSKMSWLDAAGFVGMFGLFIILYRLQSIVRERALTEEESPAEKGMRLHREAEERKKQADKEKKEKKAS